MTTTRVLICKLFRLEKSHNYVIPFRKFMRGTLVKFHDIFKRSLSPKLLILQNVPGVNLLLLIALSDICCFRSVTN